MAIFNRKMQSFNKFSMILIDLSWHFGIIYKLSLIVANDWRVEWQVIRRRWELCLTVHSLMLSIFSKAPPAPQFVVQYREKERET